MTRWLYDYSRENFARQERLNFALMACVQELVVENVRLAARVDALEHSARRPRAVRDGPGVKLACVVQRYGAEVTGGAEAHCRAIAERLAESHDVTVLTSCAQGLPHLAQCLSGRREPARAGEDRCASPSTSRGICTGSPT